MMEHGVRKRAMVLLTFAILASGVVFLLPIVSSFGPTTAEVWVVQPSTTYPITITTNVETAGNGTKSIRQTGTLDVVTTSGMSGDYPDCTTCSGQCLVLNRSTLTPEWDYIWFKIYDDYNASDEVDSEITCLCPTTNIIPAKVLTTVNWQNINDLLQAKSDTLQAEAVASGATDYVGAITGSNPTLELSYSYSNGTSDTGVKRNGKITYTNGILSKLVFNEERKGDTSGLPPNTVVIRSEKWTMGDQGVSIPGFPLGVFLVMSLVGFTLIIRKKARR